jgi:2'-5' RNA ligase
MKSESTRFFIGILLPGPMSEIVNRWRAVWYPYGLRTVPPHITVIPPFHADPEDKQTWHQITEPMRLPANPIIRLQGFGSFQRSRTVFFVNVQESEMLDDVHDRLERRLTNVLPGFRPSSRPFHPHVTIASRISESQLALIQNEVRHQSLVGHFTAEELIVLQKTSDGPYQKFASMSLDK